jgi:hypothetical protein
MFNRFLSAVTAFAGRSLGPLILAASRSNTTAKRGNRTGRASATIATPRNGSQNAMKLTALLCSFRTHLARIPGLPPSRTGIFDRHPMPTKNLKTILLATPKR